MNLVFKVFKVASYATVLLASSTAFSQGADNYPTRPVTIVAPYAPGAGAEIEGRVWANELSKNLGQQFVMDFKPGAAQILGLNYAAKQKPDGYTLAWITSTYSLLPLMEREKGFDTYKDFDPVTLMSKRSALLVVSNSLPVKNMQEYIAYAKANPGAVNFARPGKLRSKPRRHSSANRPSDCRRISSGKAKSRKCGVSRIW